MKKRKVMRYFIIDFDSTFVQSEGLEELASIVLRSKPNKDEILKKIKFITKLGMEGKISFEESLKRRLQLLKGNKLHIKEVINRLKGKISNSIYRNKNFFKKYKNAIYIVSGGFREFIEPIVTKYEINKNHILANSFVLDPRGNIIGYDTSNLLAQKNGKVRAIKSLHLKGEIQVVGDGYTDYQIKEWGEAKKFIAFTENVKREIVSNKADHVAPNFDEFLFINRLPRSVSYPKNRIKFYNHLYNDRGIDGILKKEGFVEGKMEEAQIIITGSQTKLADRLLYKSAKLMVCGISGDNKLDILEVKRFNKRGVVVFYGQPNKIAKKIKRYINEGNTIASVNIPNVKLKKEKSTHRLLHLHKNVPGILAQINGIMAKYKMNILAQYLRTNKEIGYAITDVNKKYNKNVLKELKKIPKTIRFRILY